MCWDEGLKELEFVCRLRISCWCRWAGVFGRGRREVLSVHNRGMEKCRLEAEKKKRGKERVQVGQQSLNIFVHPLQNVEKLQVFILRLTI